MRTITREATLGLSSADGAGFFGRVDATGDIAKAIHLVGISAAGFQRIGGRLQCVGVHRCHRDGSRELDDANVP
jgi:hypothetical protein